MDYDYTKDNPATSIFQKILHNFYGLFALKHRRVLLLLIDGCY